MFIPVWLIVILLVFTETGRSIISGLIGLAFVGLSLCVAFADVQSSQNVVLFWFSTAIAIVSGFLIGKIRAFLHVDLTNAPSPKEYEKTA